MHALHGYDLPALSSFHSRPTRGPAKEAEPGGGTLILSYLYRRATAAPPIIIVGMHRSGTTLLVRTLERLGVFMGALQTGNAESIFFQDINKEILDLMGCSWRCPDYLPPTKTLQNHGASFVRKSGQKLKKGLVREYWRGHLRFLWQREKTLWGWKDPRNSLMLPIWQQLFPEARVIHIFRDGRDVALSLLMRERKWQPSGDIHDPVEMQRRFEKDLSLWEFYYRRIEEALPSFEHRHRVRYESLLSEPDSTLGLLVKEMGIPARTPLADITGMIDSSRTKRYSAGEFSWTRTLVDKSPLLKELGYR